MEQKYIHYLLRSAAYITQYLSRSKGIRVNQWDLDPGAFERIEVLLPSLEEQTQIAKFLDYETAKIDALIEKQQQLIALLKEKRQAVISHAVTKGLNPDAPMRDSGVEWLGEVPAHWNHGTKFRSLAIQQRASFTNGPFGSDLLSSEITDHGVPVIYIRDLKLEGYRRKSTSHVTKKKAEQLDKFRVDPEDLLIAKVGDPPGFCCTYPVGEPAGIICQDVIRLKPDRKLISPYFMCFLLNSDAGMEAVNSVCVELTRKRFSLADLHSLRFSIPPLDEQDAIVSEIGGRLAKLDGLLAKTNDVSVLLQERRTALICAAVTGQIDVRDWKAPNPAMEEEVA
jgi:type I restriction enzyme S subunit